MEVWEGAGKVYNVDSVIVGLLNRSKNTPQTGSSGSSDKVFSLLGSQNLLLEGEKKKIKLRASFKLRLRVLPYKC